MPSRASPPRRWTCSSSDRSFCSGAICRGTDDGHGAVQRRGVPPCAGRRLPYRGRERGRRRSGPRHRERGLPPHLRPSRRPHRGPPTGHRGRRPHRRPGTLAGERGPAHRPARRASRRPARHHGQRNAGHILALPATTPGTAADPDPPELADPLRRIHALGPPPRPLPRWDPLRVTRSRLQRAPHDTPPAALAFLRDLADRLADELPRLPFALPRTVIHGDAHIGNMLRAPGGHAVLCDLDFMSLGPPEWDQAADQARDVCGPGPSPRAREADDVGEPLRQLVIILYAIPTIVAVWRVCRVTSLRPTVSIRCVSSPWSSCDVVRA
ncbi:phosphotransferase family protein [Streptantibioticus ferralitis]|uniref:phosphotransferase family protein n=1 Tax=Streptantibioticus ferralitis TaxID=236510 RepID=UPI0035576B74